ncbi:MAG: hypothetical protein H8E26_00855 [FCB group bacterium]|nr:hypothetical protein [FCB group bacterium]MBL7028706.1 hypothetical protein [Candidatus Neomarinimicrobiota bacterium]MBL7120690.1 hypothetical protein [Candidatus Neomarinimicrobiota bacterium]
MNVSHKTLKLLAALIWYIGPVILFNKGADLANEAYNIESQGWGRLFSWTAGIAIGLVKTRYIFLKSCRKNLARIDALTSPKLGQFYRVQFFFALAAMIALGAFLSRVSQGNHTFLVFVATLDISIGTALLVSSKVFWEQGVFSISKQGAQ